MAEFVRVERVGRVAVVHLDRPKVNALSRQMQNEIGAAAHDLNQDESVRAVVFYGGERNFAAGADIREMVDWDRDMAWQQAPGLHIDFDAVAAMPQPTIAAMTGYALGGGCELAMCCDIRIAADNAVLGQPEILLGINQTIMMALAMVAITAIGAIGAQCSAAILIAAVHSPTHSPPSGRRGQTYPQARCARTA